MEEHKCNAFLRIQLIFLMIVTYILCQFQYIIILVKLRLLLLFCYNMGVNLVAQIVLYTLDNFKHQLRNGLGTYEYSRISFIISNQLRLHSE